MPDEAVQLPSQWEEVLASGPAVAPAFRVTELPWFPFAINIAPDVTITLMADGKWEGSIEALRGALADGKSAFSDGTARVLLWLLLRQMEQDSRFW